MIDFTTKTGVLRALINDTDEENLEFSDEQLEVYMCLSSCNIVQASMLALQALIAKYSASAGDEYRVDTIQYKEGKSKAGYYQSLLDNLKKSIEDGTNPLVVGVPKVYGVYTWDRYENIDKMRRGIINPPRTFDKEYDQIILDPQYGPYYQG